MQNKTILVPSANIRS